MNQNSVVLIKNIAENLIKRSIKRPKYLDIFSCWTEIVDERISRLAAPYKIVGSTTKTLVIKVKKGYAIQIQHESVKILNAVNSYFNEEVFFQLKVIQLG